MPLETPTWINDLVTTNPATGDNVGQGDDHLRAIKSVLKTTFPNATKAFRFATTSAKSAGFNADTQNVLYLVDASGGGITASLPAAATAGDGFVVAVKKIDSSANAVTVDGDGAETIDGAATFALANQYDTVVLRSDGTAWHKEAFIANISAGTVVFTPAGDIAATDVQAAVEELDTEKSPKSKTDVLHGLILGAVPDGDYRFALDLGFAGTITRTSTRSGAGTGTGTFKVNTLALGGSAHSISTSEQNIARSTSNTFVAGNDLVLTIASASSLTDLSFAVHYTRTGF